jgi:hypothetical protein
MDTLFDANRSVTPIESSPAQSPKLAYRVACDDFCDDGETIEFLQESELEELGNPDREPSLDVYAEQGWVPPNVLISMGWYLFCQECERRSDCEEDDDYEGAIVDHQELGDCYFCSPNCKSVYQKRRSEWAETLDRNVEKLIARYPFLTVTSRSLINNISLQIPGLRYHANVGFLDDGSIKLFGDATIAFVKAKEDYDRSNKCNSQEN